MAGAPACERPEVYRAAIEYVGRVHRATDRCRFRFRFRPRAGTSRRSGATRGVHRSPPATGLPLVHACNSASGRHAIVRQVSGGSAGGRAKRRPLTEFGIPARCPHWSGCNHTTPVVRFAHAAWSPGDKARHHRRSGRSRSGDARGSAGQDECLCVDDGGRATVSPDPRRSRCRSRVGSAARRLHRQGTRRRAPASS